eukprot:ANDGO_04007.mRNA.1 [Fructose-bisphosphate aldolase]-lysine N-methyltransferase
MTRVAIVLFAVVLAVIAHSQTAVADRGFSNEKVAAFLSWLSENGVDTSHFTIKKIPEFGLGVVATKAIPAKENVLKVPFSVMLTSQSCFLSNIGYVLKSEEKIKSAEDVVLSICLVYQASKPDSFWRPYLDLLPEDRSLVTLVDNEVLRELDGTSLFTALNNRKEQLANEYAYVYEHLFSRFPDIFVPSVFNKSAYFWARHVVDSRAWGLQGSTYALIPMADFFNHHFLYPPLITDPEKQRAYLTARDDAGYVAGEQIFDNYGNKTNAQFLLAYGFMLDDNEHDTLNINLAFGGETVWDEAKQILLAKVGFKDGKFTGALKRNGLPVDVMRFLRIAHMTPFEVESMQKSLESDALVSLRNERSVITDLIVKINSFLDKYKTSIEEDEAALRRTNLSPTQRLLVRYRRGEKQVLFECKRILLEYWDSLLRVPDSELDWSIL